MSNQYIKQINNQNFVYPNFELAEYDVNIIHNINNNSVSGTVNSFNTTYVSSTGITFSLNFTWYGNGAEVFSGNTYGRRIVSVHMDTPNSPYFKPWRMVGSVAISNASSIIYYTTTYSFTISPTNLQESNFVSGLYNFDIRFIGANATYPVCQTLNITVP
jgi:hypothetical protein